jgi:hypothetical protein
MDEVTARVIEHFASVFGFEVRTVEGLKRVVHRQA